MPTELAEHYQFSLSSAAFKHSIQKNDPLVTLTEETVDPYQVLRQLS